MKRYVCTCMVAILMASGHAFAHEDFYATGKFGNVIVRIKSGYEYEELINVTLLGELAEKMCNALNYSDPVVLDFLHIYFKGDVTPDYFVSFNKFNLINLYQEAGQQALIEEDRNIVSADLKKLSAYDAIVIQQKARFFQAQTTLKLLEYAILNQNEIKSKQENQTSKYGFYSWGVSSIDTSAIREILSIPNSALLNDMMNVKIYRPEKFRYGVSYYLQNNRYYVFRINNYGGENVLIDVENIFDFNRTGSAGNYAAIFDSDSSFYYAGSQISKRHVINNYGNYGPYNFAYIGDGKFAIYFWYFKTEREEYEDDPTITAMGNKEKTIIYLSEEDLIIQDIDKIIKSHNF